MVYIGKNKKRQFVTQLIGGLTFLFVVFIRYSSFADIDVGQVNSGRWPVILNACFNAFAPYLFITAFVLVFIPIFIGKLTIIRDICASSFFRPLARISYSALLIQGLILFLVFFSHE
jgi:hypothetical protein